MTDTTATAQSTDTRPPKKAPSGWAIMKRVFHWVFAIACVVALVSAKPPEPNSFIHIIAGTIALAAGLARIAWRLIADVRPRLRDGLRISGPSSRTKGPRAWGKPVNQLMRLTGFVLLILVPVASLFAVFGMTTTGEETDLLELHESVAQIFKPLIPLHIVLAIAYGVLMSVNLFGLTLTRPGHILEGGKRAAIAVLAGLLVAGASLAWIWGPHDIASRFTAFQENEDAHEHDDHDDEHERDHDDD